MISSAAFQEGRSTNNNYMQQVLYMKANASAIGGNANFYIYNPYDSSSYTFMLGQGAGGYDTANNRFRGAKQIGVHKSAEQITGIHFLSSSGSFNFDVTISVYGVK